MFLGYRRGCRVPESRFEEGPGAPSVSRSGRAKRLGRSRRIEEAKVRAVQIREQNANRSDRHDDILPIPDPPSHLRDRLLDKHEVPAGHHPDPRLAQIERLKTEIIDLHKGLNRGNAELAELRTFRAEALVPPHSPARRSHQPPARLATAATGNVRELTSRQQR